MQKPAWKCKTARMDVSVPQVHVHRDADGELLCDCDAAWV
jgi:hypothetical protein